MQSPSERCCWPARASPSARKHAIEAFGKRLETLQVLGLATRLFGNAPPLVANVVERLHDRRPVVVPFEILHVESLGLAIFLDVKPKDALAKHGRPGLRGVELDHVADVEMPTHGRAVNLI